METSKHKRLPDNASLALVNGNVITVDGEFSIHQAVAVGADKILAVGSDEDIRAYTDHRTEIIDLKKKTVLPGINDSHIHAALYGISRPPMVLDLNYPAVKSIEDIVSLLAEKTKTTRPGEWIRGMGWDEGYLKECQDNPGRYPNRYDLDEVTPDNPVVLGHFTQHEVWVNSKALEIAGITADTLSPDGGVVVKESETGEPDGILREFPAQSLVMKHVPAWTKDEKRRGIQNMVRDLNRRGITSITEGALGSGGNEFQGGLLGSECIDIYQELMEHEDLTIRVGWLYLFGEYGACTYSDFCEIVPQLGFHGGFGNEWLRVAGIKIFADGTPMAGTAWMYDSYPGTNSNGSLVIPGKDDEGRTKELFSMIRLAHDNGFQVGVHAIGGRAIEATIDGFIEAETKNPRHLRHYILHNDFISDEYIERAARFGIGAGMQPILKWHFSDQVDRLLGVELSSRQFPLRKLIDAGVHIAGGSDAPVVDPDWLASIQAAVLRESKASGVVRGPEHRIRLDEAIRMYTNGGAWQDHMEHVKGSIEVGKFADLCVLDEDIFNVEPHNIKDISNVMTVAGGSVVFRQGI